MLPAEWEPQRFVQLTWPHADTDWAPYLDAAQECFLNIARAITLHEPLLVVTPTPEDVEAQLREGGVDMSQVVIEECPTNDTWARDHAFICTREPDKIGGSTDEYVEGGGNIILHDFTFNGWGMKFAANLDNQINLGQPKYLRGQIIVQALVLRRLRCTACPLARRWLPLG